MYTQTTSFTLALALTSAFAMGCTPDDNKNTPSGMEPDSTVQGRVDDGAGQQAARFGGSGTAEAASTVTLNAVDDTLTVLSEAEVDASGEYRLDAPSGQDRLVLQALSADGELLASAILEATAAEEGGEVTATPMDTESSVESAVLLAMVEDGAAAQSVNVIDLRGRIDADMAGAVRDEASDADLVIDAMADAIWTAQLSEEEVYRDYGLTRPAMFELELAASQALSEALHNDEPARLAYEAFFDAVAEVHADYGADSDAQAESGAQSSLSMLQDRLDSSSSLTWSSLHAGEREAWLTTRAAAQLLADSSASAQASAEVAGEALIQDTRDAMSTEEATQAYADYSTAMVGDGSVEGSVLGEAVVDSPLDELAVDLFLNAAVDARADFISEVTAEVDAELSGEGFGRADAEAVADVVADSRERYHGDLSFLIEDADLELLDSDLLVDMVVLVDGSYAAAGR